jgi:hypothetical protein
MDQRWADLYAAVARQAVHDLHSGYTHPRHMDAARWLEAAGLLDQAQRSPPRRIHKTFVLKRSTYHGNLEPRRTIQS